MDATDKILVAGCSGSGKTTWLKAESAKYDRVVHWDIEGEYAGQLVRLADLPHLLQRRAFRAVYRPQFAKSVDDLPREFSALAGLLLEFDCNCLLTVDEALTVLPPGGKTGGLGELLLRGRKRGLSLMYATQYLSQIPRLVEAARELVLFHLDGNGAQAVLRNYLDDDRLRRVAALPPHQFIRLQK